jgi:polyhydroxybutyrate depolymerase
MVVVRSVAGDGKKRGAVISTDSTMAYWRMNDSCDGKPVVHDYPDINTSDSSMVTSYLYLNNATGKKVELVKVIDGGHIVPNNGFSMWPKGLGRVNKDINAPEVIWDFFNGL